MAVLAMPGQEFLALFVSACCHCFPGAFDAAPVHLGSIAGDAVSPPRLGSMRACIFGRGGSHVCPATLIIGIPDEIPNSATPHNSFFTRILEVSGRARDGLVARAVPGFHDD